MAVLVEGSGAEWALEIAGPLPPLPPSASPPPVASIESAGCAELRVFDRSSGMLVPVGAGTAIQPVFFENTEYQLYLTVRSHGVEFRLPPGAELRHRLETEVGEVFHYTLDFHNDVGFAEIELRDSRAIAVLRVEVFPTKIEYRSDYVRLREEVGAITRSLVIAAHARTFGLASPTPGHVPTLPEWLALARRYFGEFMTAVEAIAREPHSKLAMAVQDVPAARARIVEERVLARRMRRVTGQSGGMAAGTTVPVPERVPGVRHRITHDTPENRYLKALLLQTRQNLLRIIRAEVSAKDDSDLSAEQKFFASARLDAEQMLQRLERLLRAPFLEEVASAPPSPPSSLLLYFHPHYAAAARLARVLNGGLDLRGEPLSIGVKNVAVLYEYWCFLKLVAILASQLGLEQQSVVQVRHLGTMVLLGKGRSSAVAFRDRGSGREVLVIYNPPFRNLPTTSQRPDIVLQIGGVDRLFVFDAKYRLAYDAEYIRYYGGVGPSPDDINTMHRYRDAIVVPDPAGSGRFRRGCVIGAAVLFPWPDEAAYEGHRFKRSLERVGIGGLPFLPQATNLVERQLRDLLALPG